jgi:hypothetical protein
LNSPPPSFSFILPPPPIPGRVSIGLIFPFSYRRCLLLPPYSPSCTLSLYPPPSHWYQPPDRTYFTFLFSDFEKKDILMGPKA